jgi:hypothetical protein
MSDITCVCIYSLLAARELLGGTLPISLSSSCRLIPVVIGLLVLERSEAVLPYSSRTVKETRGVVPTPLQIAFPFSRMNLHLILCNVSDLISFEVVQCNSWNVCMVAVSWAQSVE